MLSVTQSGLTTKQEPSQPLLGGLETVMFVARIIQALGLEAVAGLKSWPHQMRQRAPGLLRSPGFMPS